LEATSGSLANREEAYQHQQLLLSGETQKVSKQLENAQLELRHKVIKTSYYTAISSAGVYRTLQIV